jgi:hypothetical protein
MLAVEVPNLFFSNGKLINSRSFKAGTVRLLNDMVCDVVWDEIEKIKINTGNMKVILIGSGNINKLKMSEFKKNLVLYLHEFPICVLKFTFV